LAEALKECTNL
jgi:Ran GTPase-activating protein (RanGAP) involved in mRNA processing and transport